MKAAVFYEKETLRIEEVPEPTAKPGEVKLKNAYTGICGSDLHVYYNPDKSGLDFTAPHPVTGAQLPQILGHEFSGTVVEVGEGVTGVSVGDRAAVWPIYYCGECAACEQGAFNVCRKVGFHGLTSDGGGIAEFTTVPASKLHILPPSVDLRFGALVEPMAVAWHAVERSGIQPGQSALIAGAGPIGIGLWFALRAHGVERVVISEPSQARRSAIEGLGADILVDPTSEDLTVRVNDVTKGRGVDVAFEAAGAGVAVATSLANLAPRGRLVVVAIHEHPIEFNPTQLVLTETLITGVLAHLPAAFDSVIDAMSRGLYSTDGWVTEVSIDETVDAFEDLRAGRKMKVLIKL
ncbi:2,3-butanediol dehydrogenase [soil metagenome]